MPSQRGRSGQESAAPDRDAHESPSEQAETSTPDVPEGRTAAGRLARRVTSGPGTGVYEFAVAARQIGFEIQAKTVQWRGQARRLPEFSSSERQSLRVEGYPVVARVVPGASALDEHQRLLCEIDEQLESLGVTRFLMPEDNSFFRIGVRPGWRREVIQCLQRVLAKEDLLVRELSLNRPTSYQPLKDLEASRRPLDAIRVWSPVVASDRTSVLDETSAVTIDFWQDGPDGSLTASTENRYGPELPKDVLASSGHLVVRERSMETFEELARTHIDDFTFPVDLVYTWVDGSDPAWQERKREAQRRQSLPVNPASTDDSRYRDLSELRYSLRSAFAHVPWFNHIWIVADGQIPEWFESHPRVTFVTHQDIWDDPAQLPVFNSHAIESRLHHIPGLAEHYIYLNDDFFFGRMLPENLFFTSGGLARFFPSDVHIGLGEQSLGEPPGSAAAKNDRAVLLDAFGSLQTQRLKHVPYPQRRSVAFEAERAFPDLYAATAGSVFRSTSDISPVALQSWYGYRDGAAVPAKSKYSYVDVSDASQIHRLDDLAKGVLDTFCVNQTENSSMGLDEMARRLQSFLEKRFPFRSPVEK